MRGAADRIAATVAAQAEAIGAIAARVEAAASGTDAVRGRIAGLTEAASEGGRAAEVVLDASADLGVRARNLQGEVQRFLTALERAGERRRFDRHPISLPCRVAWSGGAVEVRTSDLSLGGAAVQGDLPVPTGTEATLSIAGGPALRCRIARPVDGATGLLFIDPADCEAVLVELLPRLRAAA